MDAPSPQEVQSWLEWAGQRVLSLSVSGIWPSTYRSFWPDYPDDPFTAYGYTPKSSEILPPTSVEISLMDVIYNLIPLIPTPLTRRVVQLRSLVHPIKNYHVASWEKIAKICHSERRIMARYHENGINIITNKIPIDSAIYIRERIW